MNLTEFLAADDAVAPVVALVLLISLAAVLASVIGGFGLSVAEQVSETPPQVTFDYEFEARPDGQYDRLTVRHVSGDRFEGAHVFVESDSRIDADGSSGGKAGTSLAWRALENGETRVTSGEAANVYNDADTNADLGDDEVEIVWNDGDESAVLAVWEGPRA